MVPPGMSRDVLRTAWVTRSRVSPWRRSARSDTSMEISEGRTYLMPTWEMPSMAAISLRNCWPQPLRMRSSASPERATWATLRTMESLETMGFSVSTGKLLMPSTWLLISLSATMSLAFSASSAITWQEPSLAIE